jgi:type 1 glutamine amidotransferase
MFDLCRPFFCRSVVAIVVAIVVVMSAGIVSSVKAAGPSPRIRVLIVAGNEPGESHDYVHNPDYLVAMLTSTRRFEVTRLTADPVRPVSDFLDRLTILRREDFDVVVTYLYKYADRNGYAQRIIDFVHAGGGLVAVHGSTGVFLNNPAWLRLLGARFTGHTHGRFTVDLLDRTHPVLAGLPASIEVDDEDYFHRMIAETPRTVLGTIRVRPQGNRPGASNDVMWVSESGAGRVFCTALGHGRPTWQSPVWQQLIAQAICWTAHQPIEIPPPVH